MIKGPLVVFNSIIDKEVIKGISESIGIPMNEFNICAAKMARCGFRINDRNLQKIVNTIRYQKIHEVFFVNFSQLSIKEARLVHPRLKRTTLLEVSKQGITIVD